MVNNFGRGLLVVLAFGISVNGQALAADGKPDVVLASKALNALISASNKPIPVKSSCYGSYGQAGKPRLGDLLATQLSYLYAGTNKISGQCIKGRCTVTIHHANGEDLSSAVIQFDMVRGKLRPASLHCAMTP
jgi:hypothetical protein